MQICDTLVRIICSLVCLYVVYVCVCLTFAFLPNKDNTNDQPCRRERLAFSLKQLKDRYKIARMGRSVCVRVWGCVHVCLRLCVRERNILLSQI